MTLYQPGHLMPIGGAEDKTTRRLVLERFVQLSGGGNARVAVIPTASMMAAVLGETYCDIFSNLGVTDVHCVNIAERSQANDSAVAALLDDATGIFLTGGDQLKLVSILGGTLLADKIHSRFAQGATIGGTSAGASALSEHMIAFGRDGSAPTQRMVQLSPGLGLTDRVIIDQHFRQRDRIGRLMTAVAHNPAMIGVGIDEDTAFIINPDQSCEVIGAGSVMVVDGSHLQYSNIHVVKRYGPVAVLGTQVHMLTQGCRYDLVSRTARPPQSGF